MRILTHPQARYFEKIPVSIYNDNFEAVKYIAHEIAALIRMKIARNEMAVLGLATGSTPIRLYDELVRMHREEGLSFKNVITFNLDEYYPIEPSEIQSYVRFMNEYLFDHIDIDMQNVHIPDGTVARHEVSEYCQRYELAIENAGGLDIQILGIGSNGHIAFNEPGSRMKSVTRLVNLSHKTRISAASAFFGEEYVPTRAITMGMQTILKAQRIFLLAWGDGKAGIIKSAVEGKVNEQVPASFLQEHKNVEFIIDTAAAQELTRVNQPWLVENIDWDDMLIRKAVVQLCQKLEKPILKLTDTDYLENGLSDLVNQQGNAYNINIKVFNEIQHTITGWPGGKPNADDSTRPERKSPYPKKVLIFSPHPDDDIISMGGTFIRLVDQGHDVHVAYQTSGNIAVFDEDVIRFADFADDYAKEFGEKRDEGSLLNRVRETLRMKKPGESDSKEIRDLKGLIRRGEAKATCRFVGVPDDNVHFQNLPFYETGMIRKNPVGQEDIDITKELIKKIKPDQIFAAGDLSDPHGTHRVCLAAVMEACSQLKVEEPELMNDCWVWFYRGAWAEFNIEEIEMAVPISPSELIRKRRGIFKHESQKDRPMFPGTDPREFWQRAEDRTTGTADLYNALGLAEYEAIEGFKRWHF